MAHNVGKKRIKVVVLAGKKGSGKTTLAKMLCENNGYVRMSFADPIKDIICELFDINRKTLEKVKNLLPTDEYQYTFNWATKRKFMKLTGLGRAVMRKCRFKRGFHSMREVMQFLATDVIRAIDKDWFVNKMVERISASEENIVIDDLRFTNEFETLWSKYIFFEFSNVSMAKFIYIYRDIDNNDAHESENSLTFDDISNMEHICNNEKIEDAFSELTDIITYLKMEEDNKKEMENTNENEGELCEKRCLRCDSQLILECVEDLSEIDDEPRIMRRYKCPNCGMIFNVYSNTSNEEETGGQTIGYQGFGYCMECGRPLAWSSDFMRSEIEGCEDEISDEKDSLAQNLFCCNCGTDYECLYPWLDEEKDYPFWKEQHENESEENVNSSFED